jgi:alkylhydroperoxidase family enzyme
VAVFALVPDVLKHAAQGFALYRSPDRILDPMLRELAQTRAGWARGSQFVYSQHCKACRSLGVEEEKIDAITFWQISPLFDEVERAVLTYTDDLTLGGGRVADGTFDALHRHLSDEEILELTYITAMYEMHATICRALKLEFDDRIDPVVEVLPPEGEESRDVGADISLPEG